MRSIFISSVLAISLVLTPNASLLAQSNLPSLGEDGGMSFGAERRLGDQIAREIYRDPDFISDPELDEYLTRVMAPLYRAAKQRGELSPDMNEQFAWATFLIRDKSVNAFALPGGYMGVHLGLMGLVDTPDELASVLAHELSHVTQRHIARGMSKQSAAAPLVMASILVGILAMRSNPQAAAAAITTGQAGAIQHQLNFTRDMEREADRVGFTLMQPAGFAPSGFVAMFNKLGNAGRLNDSGGFPYLRSHPLTTERIADMTSRVGEFDRTRTQTLTTSNAQELLYHRLMAARARVLADPSFDAQRAHIHRAEKLDASTAAADKLIALYAGTLSAWQQKDAAKARSFYAELQNQYAAQAPSSNITQAMRLLAAQLQLPALLDINSQSRTEMLYASEQLLALRVPEPNALAQATSRLKDWVSNNPKDFTAWRQLSRLQLAQNQRARALMAEGEALIVMQDVPAALAQYQAAQNMIRQTAPIDTFDAAIVDSKVRELQRKIRDQPRISP
jgi:predicted Zn-dependent protease